MTKYWAKTKKFFTRDYKKDFESYNKQPHFNEVPPKCLLEEYAFITVVVHMIILLLAHAKNLEDLFQTTNVVYTSSLVIIAVLIDVFHRFIPERKLNISKGVIYILGFMPVFIYCIAKLYVAAVELGQHNVIYEIIVFILSNMVFYLLIAIYTQEDFHYLQSKGRMATGNPETLILSEKRTLAVYNILLYSFCYVIIVAQYMFVIMARPIFNSSFMRELMKPPPPGYEDGGVIVLCFISFFLLGICALEFYSVVTILQGLWVLLWNPKHQNKVSVMAIV